MHEKVDQAIRSLSAGAMIGYFFGGWTTMLTLLWWMVVIDFFTGWAAAWINGELKSRKGYYGIARKVAIFLMVTIAHLIDRILGDAHYFRDAVIFFYLANELLSVIENVGRMGVPMPDILRNAVKIFESRSQAPKNSNMPDPEPEKKDQGQKPAV
ncbi:phage holin family protein [Paenibacillus polymyxa]|uniref:phage holin family protein n=1 Tax=Paenibacillus polymyxa TaxID=1406 RepID=UPI001F58455F|nr:phage holin family protein [Paenibacillus polymyxa]UNL94002.1 holin [Paenibacillus polymyxa]WHX35258.1 phage holin family protein [Paenibacillus polymyxa]